MAFGGGGAGHAQLTPVQVVHDVAYRQLSVRALGLGLFPAGGRAQVRTQGQSVAGVREPDSKLAQRPERWLRVRAVRAR